MSAGVVRVFRWEMGVTRADFLRLLPAMDGCRPGPGETAGNAGSEAALQWRVAWSERAERRIGAMALPVLDVELRVEAPDGAEAERFARRFLLAFQRAGG